MDISIILLLIIIVLAFICIYLMVWMLKVRKKMMYVAEMLEEMEKKNQDAKKVLEQGMAAERARQREKSLSGGQLKKDAKKRSYKSLLESLSENVSMPLAAAAGYMDAVEKGVVEDEEKENYIKTARDKIEITSKFADEVTEWLRIETGEREYNFQLRDIAGATSAILESWEPQLKSAGRTYSFEVQDEHMEVLFDYKAYGQMINSLMENTLEHSGGDGLVTVFKKDNGFAYLCVADNGKGIAKEDIPYVFDCFYKGKEGKSKGAGLGLTVTKGLAAAHGWTTYVQNLPDGGAAFFVNIPVTSN